MGCETCPAHWPHCWAVPGFFLSILRSEKSGRTSRCLLQKGSHNIAGSAVIICVIADGNAFHQTRSRASC